MHRLLTVCEHMMVQQHGGVAAPQTAVQKQHKGAQQSIMESSSICNSSNNDNVVLTAENWATWQQCGYMIVRQAVPRSNVQRLVDEVYQYIGADPAEPSSWYRFEAGHVRGGTSSAQQEAACSAGQASRIETTLNMWQSQGQWDNRQHPRVHQAFAELWGRAELWVSIDDMEFKPPSTPEHSSGWGKPLQLHCDINHETLREGLAMEPPTATQLECGGGLRVQGMLYCNDCGDEDGAWRCVPGFHRNFNRWVARQPRDQPLDIARLEGDPSWAVKNVAASAGDLVIWHSFLPHGNSQHTGSMPRIGQPITMWPHDMTHWPTYRTTGNGGNWPPQGTEPRLISSASASEIMHGHSIEQEEERLRRILMWAERLPGGCYNWPPLSLPDPRAEARYRPSTRAQLSPLGRKLLGLDAW